MFQDEVDIGGAQTLFQQFIMPEEGSGLASGDVHLGFVAGIMQLDRLLPFEKVFC